MQELTISLQSGSEKPLYEQIYEYIKNDIQSGMIQSGERLPSTRALCRHLEVSRTTVEQAYEQLLSEGYIESRPYRGYFVTEIEGLYRLTPAGTKRMEEIEKKETAYRYDFTPNGVDLNSFPYNTWRKLSKECLVDDRAELFRLGDPQGEYGLRSAVCSYLHQARGANCRPEQVIMGAGNDYILMLLSTIIGNRHRIAFENPTYKQAYRLFRNLSCDVCTVDMDKRGMNVEKLEESGADIAFVMPSHQYPLGVVMPIRRRMELLQWADAEEGRYIIEDDYDSEFRYRGKPIPALQGYDSSGKVIYTGTFSKSIAPAIRMSYIVLPEPVLEIYRKRCRFLNSTLSKVDQLILEKFIGEGYYERHLNKTRALYKSRHDTLLTCLKELDVKLGGRFTVSGENAGVHLLLHFRDSGTENSLIRRAGEKGVRVYGLSSFYVKDTGHETEEPVILLGYANMSEEKIREAAGLLGEAWR